MHDSPLFDAFLTGGLSLLLQALLGLACNKLWTILELGMVL